MYNIYKYTHVLVPNIHKYEAIISYKNLTMPMKNSRQFPSDVQNRDNSTLPGSSKANKETRQKKKGS